MGIGLPIPPPVCSVDADCLGSETCELGFCQASRSCRISGDCETGEVCVDELCRLPIECTADTDCAPGERCDARMQCTP